MAPDLAVLWHSSIEIWKFRAPGQDTKIGWVEKRPLASSADAFPATLLGSPYPVTPRLDRGVHAGNPTPGVLRHGCRGRAAALRCWVGQTA